MQRTVETESRHLEFPTAVGYEHDPEVLEYYPQPGRLKFEFVDSDGEIHEIDHTPDFLVITERGIWFEECKHWRKLEGLARRQPWRYNLDPDNQWRSPAVGQWLAERGIGYRIQTDRDISQRRVENILFLEDFLDPGAPPCPIDVAIRVRDALASDATLYLAELYEKADCRPDDVFKLIADGELIAEIDDGKLNEPNRCRVFRDSAVRAFERARRLPAMTALAGTVEIAVGTRLTYDQQPYTIVMVGGSKAVLESESGSNVSVSLDTLASLAQNQDIRMVGEGSKSQEAMRLSDFSEKQLRVALNRMERLEKVKKPNRTERRLRKVVEIAKLTGTDELVALVPRLRDRGNRNPRLSTDQEDAMAEIIREEYLTSRAPNAKHCYRKLVALCTQRDIKAPSYPTLIERIRSLPQQGADRARHGNRLAYQNAEFVNVLHVDTPVHGSRAFQYIHMDHTQLDIELVSSKTGKALGRPWLSLAIDAYTRRIVGLYLSYDPPSYRSNLMLMRDMVKRYRRLPQFIVVDNGADFRSEDFKRFCELMRIHLRYRPAGQPRHGAVMERIFGRANTEYVHNLAGNTKDLKNVRQTTGKFRPSRLAEWSLENMYYGLEYWAFTYYDQEVHSTLGLSPREAFERSEASSGARSHRIVTLTDDFLVLTCPTVDRMGQRVVDHQRGIKVHANFFYWCPEFRNPKLDGKKVPVRYDPWNAATVYVQIEKRWLPARCKSLAGLGQFTEKERELLSEEMRNRHRVKVNEAVSSQRLAEFMRTFTPKGAAQLAMERQQENRELYEHSGIGAIPVTPAAPLLKYDFAQPLRVNPCSAEPEVVVAADVAPAVRPATVSPLNVWPDDTPEFEKF
ncbi:hypothetical protein AYR66_27130 [Noviherbaspirillum denitrificans]|uniref:Integrase catalytic domain-containing protein n=2 Tax=Noviherbaspirillum denitrificans TaxID=1968433 RepID=A0A254TK92_9BURK|nr:hypothetical protein AYR66_27130 [Noviherbaspirillum denitrificans]